MNRWQYVVGLLLFVIGADLRWRYDYQGFWWGSLECVLISVGFYLIIGRFWSPTKDKP